MKLHKLGMRTIKTGIGVMLCVSLGYINFNLVDKTFYSAIDCVVCMQNTVKGSFTVGINRLKGTFVGGLVGFLFVLIGPGNPILSCLGIITTIYICNLININKSITIACVVYCAIHLGIGTADPVYYSIHRIIDTSIGVLIGIAVNYIIYRPDYLDRIHNEIKIIENTSIKLLKKEIEMGVDIDTSYLQSEIKKLEVLYKNFLDELEYRNDEVDDKEINRIINICNQIYMHLQVLGNMKDKCYINEENYIKSKDLYYELSSDIEIKEDISPVYNYHISMIIENINEIRGIDEKI